MLILKGAYILGIVLRHQVMYYKSTIGCVLIQIRSLNRHRIGAIFFKNSTDKVLETQS